jgi:hypothetical protein
MPPEWNDNLLHKSPVADIVVAEPSARTRIKIQPSIPVNTTASTTTTSINVISTPNNTNRGTANNTANYSVHNSQELFLALNRRKQMLESGEDEQQTTCTTSDLIHKFKQPETDNKNKTPVSTNPQQSDNPDKDEFSYIPLEKSTATPQETSLLINESKTKYNANNGCNLFRCCFDTPVEESDENTNLNNYSIQ